jgi:hypothetical protein
LPNLHEVINGALADIEWAIKVSGSSQDVYELRTRWRREQKNSKGADTDLKGIEKSSFAKA